MKIKGKILYGVNIAKDFGNLLEIAITIKTYNNKYMMFYDYIPQNSDLSKSIYHKLHHGTPVEITYSESSCMVKFVENHPAVEINYDKINNITILNC